MKWKGGTFESVPPEPNHTPTITKSLRALLSESSQILKKTDNPTLKQEEEETKFVTRMTAMTYEGADFVVTVPAGKGDSAKGFGGIQDADRLAAWARHAEKAAQRLGEKFGAGSLTHIAGQNMERHLLLLPENGRTFVIGWPSKTDPGQLLEQSKKLVETWES
jgi:hypothetical protein